MSTWGNTEAATYVRYICDKSTHLILIILV